MKFVHIADVHFDIPLTTLDTRGLAEKRRLEQRNAFKKVVDYIKDNNIEYFFICGDVYEHEYVKKSTIEYINRLFETIPRVKIFIVPGNHDPYIKNSYYMTFNFAKNVKIFTQKVEKIQYDNICIYGYGFDDFYIEAKNKEELIIEDREKINILLTHGDIYGTDNNNMKYNQIPKSLLNELEFDYVAMGHIHKRECEGKIVYPGSLTSLGFDELGEHRNDSWRNR